MTFDTHITRYGETIQIWGATTETDSMGNTTKAWTEDKGTFTGVVIRPTAHDIEMSAGRLSDTDKKLIAVSYAAIETGDRVEIDGIMYDLLGTHADWQMKLSGATLHQQAFLRRVL